MLRTEIINKLIIKRGYNTYLEIGLFDGANFNKVKINTKVSVDPESRIPATFPITSDKFFGVNNEKFDIIFIDGLHHSGQVYKDIKNSLECLNDGGVIVCHDMLPTTEKHQQVPRVQEEWNGDCWKAFVNIRMEQEMLDMYTVDTDWGIGIISKSDTKDMFENEKELNYTNFVSNKQAWMNVISVDGFLNKIND